MHFATKKGQILILAVRENNRWKMIKNCAQICGRGGMRVLESSEFTDSIPAVLQGDDSIQKKKVSDKHLKMLLMRLQKLTACS